MMTFLVIVLIVAFISGAPLFAVMLGSAALGALSSTRGFEIEFDGMVSSAFGVGTGDQATVLSTIPLFIYAGYLLAEARTADRLVRFANAAMGWVPGGLAIVTIFTCALFTVFTGASGVTIVALGGLLLPALIKQGYPERFSLGLIAGTGSVGLLFPPALPLFIYGTVYGLTQLDRDWDTRRFLFAGIVPGMVLVGMLCLVAVAVALVKRLPRQKFDVGECVRSLLVALPELLIPFAVIGGLAIGFALPEVAALTVVYVVLLEVVITRQLDWRVLWRTSRESLALVGAIFIIILASTAFTNYLVTEEVPKALVEWTRANVSSKIVFLLAINGILLLVGTVMDIFSAIVIILPLIAPIAKAYGIDPYHLGVIFLLNLEVGYLHPPVGLNLFITSVRFGRPVTEVMWATVPFLITMIVALVVVTYVPQLTVVPEPERRGNAAGLLQIVHETVDESRSVREVALAVYDGTPVKGPDGAQVIKRISECDAITADLERGKCTGLFIDVTKCRKAPPEGQTVEECEKRAIAKWVVDNLEVFSVTEVTLVNEEGEPVKGADGKPTVKKLSECDAITSELDKETCRELFLNASNCKTNPPGGQTIEECQQEAIATWVGENLETEDEE
jgi:C4-dicarboxylate transporter, DctM subunit